MNQVRMFRDSSRRLAMNLGTINKSECCCGGISDTQCYALVEIGREPNISVKELAGILRMDKSGISRIVEDLVQKQFVERKPSSVDRRYVVLNLTEKGIDRFNKIDSDMNAKFKIILDRIPKEKRKQLIESLELYNSACEMMD